MPQFRFSSLSTVLLVVLTDGNLASVISVICLCPLYFPSPNGRSQSCSAGTCYDSYISDGESMAGFTWTRSMSTIGLLASAIAVRTTRLLATSMGACYSLGQSSLFRRLRKRIGQQQTIICLRRFQLNGYEWDLGQKMQSAGNENIITMFVQCTSNDGTA